MITGKDIGKIFRFKNPGEYHAGKHYKLVAWGDGLCKLEWTNINYSDYFRKVYCHEREITLVKKPKKNWFKQLRKHMKIKFSGKGEWDWSTLKKGGK